MGKLGYNSNRLPKTGCAAVKSAAIIWCYHIDSEQNLLDIIIFIDVMKKKSVPRYCDLPLGKRVQRRCCFIVKCVEPAKPATILTFWEKIWYALHDNSKYTICRAVCYIITFYYVLHKSTSCPLCQGNTHVCMWTKALLTNIRTHQNRSKHSLFK